MTKLLLLLFLTLSLVSCQSNDDCAQQEAARSHQQSSDCTINPPTPPTEPDQSFRPDDETLEDAVPNEALIFEASVQFTNFNRNDEAKVYRALDIIKKVVASHEFRQRVINFSYQGKQAFVDNQGLSNQQVYHKILQGREDLRPVVDHRMDLDLQLYYSVFNTVGYTYPNTLRIWMNTKFFYSYTAAQVAGNIFHEWLHKLGFEHASSYSVARDASVPYAIGYLIEELGKQYE
jgi:hypothetical protein